MHASTTCSTTGVPPSELADGGTWSKKYVSPGVTEQPCPAPNGEIAVWRLVIDDMFARDRAGKEKYGTRLQIFNGRDALVDAYQECLDLCVYLRQEIEERDKDEANRNSLLNSTSLEHAAAVQTINDLRKVNAMQYELLRQAERRALRTPWGFITSWFRK